MASRPRTQLAHLLHLRDPISSNPRLNATPTSRMVPGIFAGLIASVPQVLLTQLEERIFLMPEGHADIGPRFVERFAASIERPLSPPMHWLLAGVFHFAYAAAWGALYAAIQQRRRVPPLVAGFALAGVIYTLAFSRVGVATQTGSEPHPFGRSPRRYLIHLTPALTFSLLTAYCYEWLNPSITTR